MAVGFLRLGGVPESGMMKHGAIGLAVASSVGRIFVRGFPPLQVHRVDPRTVLGGKGSFGFAAYRPRSRRRARRTSDQINWSRLREACTSIIRA